jgi:hypothetical protein
MVIFLNNSQVDKVNKLNCVHNHNFMTTAMVWLKYQKIKLKSSEFDWTNTFSLWWHKIMSRNENGFYTLFTIQTHFRCRMK